MYVGNIFFLEFVIYFVGQIMHFVLILPPFKNKKLIQCQVFKKLLTMFNRVSRNDLIDLNIF